MSRIRGRNATKNRGDFRFLSHESLQPGKGFRGLDHLYELGRCSGSIKGVRQNMNLSINEATK